MYLYLFAFLLPLETVSHAWSCMPWTGEDLQSISASVCSLQESRCGSSDPPRTRKPPSYMPSALNTSLGDFTRGRDIDMNLFLSSKLFKESLTKKVFRAESIEGIRPNHPPHPRFVSRDQDGDPSLCGSEVIFRRPQRCLKKKKKNVIMKSPSIYPSIYIMAPSTCDLIAALGHHASYQRHHVNVWIRAVTIRTLVDILGSLQFLTGLKHVL